VTAATASLLANAPSDTSAKRWAWSQHWINLLFLHWRVAAELLLPHVPAEVEIDTDDDSAWVSLVLFRLKVRPRWLPFMPGLSTLNEVNLRTYVRCQNQPGISFLSLHANNRWAIRLARKLTPLPYHDARIRYQASATRSSFECTDLARPDCRLAVDFRPAGALRQPIDGTRDHWLLERYRLFIADRSGNLQMAEVFHPPWQFQEAETVLWANTLATPFGLDLSRPPDAIHFSPGVRTRFGGFVAVRP
jgi:uncharacterized protein